jgi:hypothetical protein
MFCFWRNKGKRKTKWNKGKETPKPREEAFICIFCGRAGHLDEFCFRRKRIERRRVEYARNSCHDEFIDFPPHSYSRIPPRSYSRASSHTFSRALPHTSSCALPQFAHGPNHRSYGFSQWENHFVPRRFGYGHILIVVIISHIGLVSLLEGLTLTLSRDTWTVHTFSHRGSHPTWPNGELERIVKTSSDRMVKCWIPKIYLTNPSMEPSTPSRPM